MKVEQIKPVSFRNINLIHHTFFSIIYLRFLASILLPGNIQNENRTISAGNISFCLPSCFGVRADFLSN